MNEIQVIQFAGQPIAIVRRRAKMHEIGKVTPDACGLVWNALKAQRQAKPGRHVAVYLDDERKIEVGVELGGPFSAMGEVIESSLPAGTVATAIHLGPYQTLGETHQRIHDSCRQNRREPIRPCWEIYDHWRDEWNNDPSKIRT